MSPRISVPRWAPYALLFGLYLTARGYQSLDGDQAYRLPLLLHAQDPALFASDPFVRAFDAFNPHRGYLALLDLASRPLGLSIGLFSLFAATFALTCVGLSRLARSAWPDGGPNVGLVAVGLVLLARSGNIGTNHLFEPILLDRLIGFSLGWCALALAVEGETWRPSVLVGLAAVIHPSVGLQIGGLMGASWVVWSIGGRWTGHSWRSTLVGLLTLAAALLPGALPNLIQGRRLFEGLSPEEFRRIGVELQMAQHMVPSLWRRPQWLAWGGYIALALVSLNGRAGWASTDRSGHPRTRFALLFGVLLAGLGISYVMVEVVGDLRATVFQPFRMATIARGLALIAVAGRCARLWRRGDGPSRTRVLVLAAGLTGDWAFVVAVAFEFAATFGEAIGRRHALRSPLTWNAPQPDPLPQGADRPTRSLCGMVSPGGADNLLSGSRSDTRSGPTAADTAGLSRTSRGFAARTTSCPGQPGSSSGPGNASGRPPRWGGIRRESRITFGLTLAVLVYGLLFLSQHDTERGHRPIAIALLAGVVVRLFAPRLRPGWTCRRLAFATFACGLVPASALLAPLVAPASPITAALVARCRFHPLPTDDVERLAVWARANTPADARFITPPGPKTFRLWSGRAVAFNRAASPYHAEGLRDWSDRFRAHVGFAGSTAEFVRAYLADRHGLEARYGRLSRDDLAALAEDQGADHILAASPEDGPTDTGGPLRLLKAEGRYALYRVVRPMSRVAAVDTAQPGR